MKMTGDIDIWFVVFQIVLDMRRIEIGSRVVREEDAEGAITSR